jgi:hypothetical protein
LLNLCNTLANIALIISALFVGRNKCFFHLHLLLIKFFNYDDAGCACAACCA